MQTLLKQKLCHKISSKGWNTNLVTVNFVTECLPEVGINIRRI